MKLSTVPFVPCSYGAQSGNANGIPNGCHGRPQCQSPPRNSNAVTWVWASIVPLTWPSGLEPVNARPVASTPASG